MMYPPPPQSTRFVAGVAVATLGMLALVAGWRHTHPPRRLDGDAYEAAKAYLTKMSREKSTLLFPVLGLDPAAKSRLRSDGNYEETGWVEETNHWGNRVHRDWLCVVRHGNGNQWNCVYLKIDRFTFGTYVPD